ncbi:unnamed protein product, partial [Oppiella nova]
MHLCRDNKEWIRVFSSLEMTVESGRGQTGVLLGALLGRGLQFLALMDSIKSISISSVSSVSSTQASVAFNENGEWCQQFLVFVVIVSLIGHKIHDMLSVWIGSTIDQIIAVISVFVRHFDAKRVVHLLDQFKLIVDTESTQWYIMSFTLFTSKTSFPVVRSRRSIDCTANSSSCCRESWDNWILQPIGYNANYCRG